MRALVYIVLLGFMLTILTQGTIVPWWTITCVAEGMFLTCSTVFTRVLLTLTDDCVWRKYNVSIIITSIECPTNSAEGKIYIVH